MSPEPPALLEAFSTVILSVLPSAKLAGQARHKHSLPLARFLHETIRRSRTDYTTLCLALYYFIRFRDCSASAPSTYIPLLCGRRLFLISLMAASKFLHDRSFSNRAWSRLSGLPLDRLLMLERLFYTCIDYRLHVAKQTFARWCLLLGECCTHALACTRPSSPKPFSWVAPAWVSLFTHIRFPLNDPFSVMCLVRIAHRRMAAYSAAKAAALAAADAVNVGVARPASPSTTDYAAQFSMLRNNSPVAAVASAAPITPASVSLNSSSSPVRVHPAAAYPPTPDPSPSAAAAARPMHPGSVCAPQLASQLQFPDLRSSYVAPVAPAPAPMYPCLSLYVPAGQAPVPAPVPAPPVPAAPIVPCHPGYVTGPVPVLVSYGLPDSLSSYPAQPWQYAPMKRSLDQHVLPVSVNSSSPLLYPMAKRRRWAP
ncbi:cyclin Pas1 [Schizosaccharomyces japonicus yFS275]|uniref:Cyclin Pas1 n=1 Tax=Schizosaccharomyces japonicus (strain yFS275 / FY16936) TaxID=402676 RepID=B6K4M9_SCHJY|nr:cyclin Pas1 [Schizosaccharomyces japonicus yFS275]EEB08436.1 cyclin Pas1 [Schizosaccharomyces japonicus yFS275]